MCTPMYRKPKTVLALKFFGAKGRNQNAPGLLAHSKGLGSLQKELRPVQGPHPSPLWKPVATGSTYPSAHILLSKGQAW